MNKGIQRIDVYLFKSKKTIEKNRHVSTFLRFTLKIFTYKDTSSSKTALDNLLASSNPNTGLSYDWDFVLSDGEMLYWIDAPCLLSKQNWHKLITRFKSYFLHTKSFQNNSFECQCGFGCKAIMERK